MQRTGPALVHLVVVFTVRARAVEELPLCARGSTNTIHLQGLSGLWNFRLSGDGSPAKLPHKYTHLMSQIQKSMFNSRCSLHPRVRSHWNPWLMNAGSIPRRPAFAPIVSHTLGTNLSVLRPPEFPAAFLPESMLLDAGPSFSTSPLSPLLRGFSVMLLAWESF